MIRRIQTLICILILIVIPYSGHAFTFTPQSIEELRKATPSYFTYQGSPNGRSINIKAPITMPNAFKMPIERVCFHVLEKNEISSKQESISKSKQFGSAAINSDIKDPMNLVVSTLAIEEKTSYRGPGYKSIYFPTVLEERPSCNTTPTDEPFKKTEELIKIVYPDVSLYFSGQYATGGGYDEISADGKPKPSDDELLKTKPLPGYEKGYYISLAGQSMHGIQVFPRRYFAIMNDNEPSDPLACVQTEYFDSNNFDMEAFVLKDMGAAVSDVQLAPFEQIEKVILAYLNNGSIREIDSISLGYMLYYAQPTTIQQAFKGVDMLLVPTWELIGTFVSGTQEEATLMSERERLTIHALTSGGDRSFRIDAITGLPLDQYADPAPRYYDLSGVMP